MDTQPNTPLNPESLPPGTPPTILNLSKKVTAYQAYEANIENALALLKTATTDVDRKITLRKIKELIAQINTDRANL